MATYITEDVNVYYENEPENMRTLFPNDQTLTNADVVAIRQSLSGLQTSVAELDAKKLKRRTIQATSNSSGGIGLTSVMLPNVVFRSIVQIIPEDASNYYIVFPVISGGTFWIMLYSWPSLSVVKNTTVTLNITYYEETN